MNICYGSVFYFLIIAMNAAKSSWAREDACSTVSCYHNSMCVIDPSTDEPICQCPLKECDDAPPFPVCADGDTYKSVCHVRLQMCIAQKWITVQHIGSCGEKQECEQTTACPYYGQCEDGACTCKECDENFVIPTDFDITIQRKRRLSVCGSDGVTYPSECHLQYQSCSSRTAISVARKSSCFSRRHALKTVTISLHNHLLEWLRSFDDAKSEYRHFNMTSHRGGPCPAYELRGCLPASHPRRKYLGVFTLIAGYLTGGSPVYRKLHQPSSSVRNVYLSRYASSTMPNGSWVVGSRVGSGSGWFGVLDPSKDPRHISGTWFSTAGRKESIWVKEPKVHGRCLMEITHTISECNLGEERSSLGRNWQSFTQDIPLYELRTRNRTGQELEIYNPEEKIIVEVSTNNRALRFTSVHVFIRNDLDECGLPIVLKKTLKKFEVLCDGKVFRRTGKRMKRVTLHLRAPSQGCLTFSAFVKSVRGEIFYDTPFKESTEPRPLTAMICSVGYKPTKDDKSSILS